MELGTQLEVTGQLLIAVALSPVRTGDWVDLISALDSVKDKFFALSGIEQRCFKLSCLQPGHYRQCDAGCIL